MFALQTITSHASSALSMLKIWTVDDSHLKSKGLLSLPPELLAGVMEYLDWNDILNARQCNRILCAVSRTRSVWLELLKRYCDTIFYRPFFLKKSLKYCCAADLEEAVTRAWRPVPSLVDGQSNQPLSTIQMAPEGSRWMALAGITPDGSCFLYIGRHGEVYYYFIERPSEPHLLVPSPYECSCRTTTTVVTLDHLGYQGLDPGSTSSLEDRLFPTKFNMAIINNVCHRDPKRKELLIEIWQITAALHEGHVQSYTCSKLASFCEDPNYYVQHCSLRGTELAYQAKSSGTIVVVDWTRISASSSDYSRVYLQSLNAQCFALIPGKRLLIRGGRGLGLREWGRDGVASSLVPSTVRRQIDWRQITLPAHPSWEREFDLDVPMVRDMTLIPFFANGSTRFVLLAEKHIYGLDISSGPVNEGLNPRVFTLAEGKFDADCLDHFTSYRRGICVLRDQTGVGFQHSWPDDPVHWPSRVDAFKLSRTSYEVLYNDAHTRMVIFSPNDMQYYCISL